jgi:hypothetical protein
MDRVRLGRQSLSWRKTQGPVVSLWIFLGDGETDVRSVTGLARAEPGFDVVIEEQKDSAAGESGIASWVGERVLSSPSEDTVTEIGTILRSFLRPLLDNFRPGGGFFKILGRDSESTPFILDASHFVDLVLEETVLTVVMLRPEFDLENDELGFGRWGGSS